MSVTSEGLWERYPLYPDDCSSEEDAFTREEIEHRLYSQLYHDSPNGKQDVGLHTYVKVTDVSPEGKPCNHDNNTMEDNSKECSKYVEKKYDKPAVLLTCSSELSDDSEVQVIKEIVTVALDDSDKEISKPTNRSLALSKNIKRRQRTISKNSVDSDDDLPLWSRLDSGAHSSDISLNVHMRTHGRQRHDSIISHTGSALGDDDDPLVTLPEQHDFSCLETILDKLPDEGWNIISTDNPLTARNARRLRYHSHKCHNCNQRGHMANSCPQPKKVRHCNLCGEVHRRAWEYKNCPQAVCGWCSQTGHSKDSCRDARSIRVIVCQRCRGRGHRAKACHELWRQWHATTQLQKGAVYPTVPQPPTRKEVVYCSNCSHRGHTANQCKVVAWNEMPILSPYVSHYNTFGEFKDFWKFWSKHPKGQGQSSSAATTENSHSERYLADTSSPASQAGSKRKGGVKDVEKNSKKRKIGSDAVAAVDGHLSRKQLRKAKKIRKKIAKKDGPLVRKLVNSPGTSQPHPKPLVGKHRNTKRKGPSSDNKMADDSFSQNEEVRKRRPRRKNVHHVKIKERKKSMPDFQPLDGARNEMIRKRGPRRPRHENFHHVEVKEDKRSMTNWQQLDGAMKSQTVRSWNEAF